MRRLYLPTIVLLVAAGTVFAQQQSNGSDSPAALHITWSASDELNVSGNVSSSAHEVIIRDTAKRFFGIDALDASELSLEHPPATPPGWASITDTVMRAIAGMHSATATVTPANVSIRGVADPQADVDLAIERVQAALPAGMTLHRDIIVLSDSAPYPVLCRRRFLAHTRDNRIEFYRSGAALRSGAFAMLVGVAVMYVELSTYARHWEGIYRHVLLFAEAMRRAMRGRRVGG